MADASNPGAIAPTPNILADAANYAVELSDILQHLLCSPSTAGVVKAHALCRQILNDLEVAA